MDDAGSDTCSISSQENDAPSPSVPRAKGKALKRSNACVELPDPEKNTNFEDATTDTTEMEQRMDVST